MVFGGVIDLWWWCCGKAVGEEGSEQGREEGGQGPQQAQEAAQRVLRLHVCDDCLICFFWFLFASNHYIFLFVKKKCLGRSFGSSSKRRTRTTNRSPL